MKLFAKQTFPISDISSAPPYWAEMLDAHHGRFRAKVGGLHCSLCTGTLEKALGRMNGVEKVAVSLTHEQALVEYDPSRVHPDDMLSTLRDVGYTVWDPRKLRPFEEEEAILLQEGKRLLLASGASLLTIALIMQIGGIWQLLVPLAIGGMLLSVAFLLLRNNVSRLPAILGMSGLVVLIAAMLTINVTGVAVWAIPFLVGGLALSLVFGVSRHFLVMAAHSLRRGILNQHVMLEAGAFAGLIGGFLGAFVPELGYPAAPFFAVSVLITTYHTFSEWLSLLVKTRSSQAVKRLLDLQPDTARVVREDRERELPVREVVRADLVRIRPGERIPVDGIIVSGHSAVSEALVTGEPTPVEKEQGDQVIGGSINGTGTLLVQVTAVGEESFLQQVIRHLEDARALKPGLLHLVDRILQVYTPTVLLLSLLALIGWIGLSFLLTGQADLERAVFAALSVLVMGYPCAVGIAAPLSIVRGAGEAADQGIIMRTGEAFQAFGSVSHILLDKTGTLTFGKPSVVALSALGDEMILLEVAAAAEAGSEHPLAAAVLGAAEERGIAIPSVEAFEAVAGLGVHARLDGKQILVGRPTFLQEAGVDVTSLSTWIIQQEEAGYTVIAVAKEQQPLGAIALGDTIRVDAGEAIAAIRKSGLIPVLLTGDNPRAAAHVAHALGIDEVHASILPGQKADIVREYQAQGHRRVAMVGDGINDAPALMQADVGVAMGSGTDIAIESSDIIILSNRLMAVPRAREISRESYRKTRHNVVLAFLFNGIGVPLAMTGLVYPVWAMVAMALSVTSLFVNSLWGRPDLLFDALSSVGKQRLEPRQHAPKASSV